MNAFTPYHACDSCRATLNQLFADNPWITTAHLAIPDIGGCTHGCPLVCVHSEQVEALDTKLAVYSQGTPWGETIHWVQRQ